jgi:hypothetical protein
LTFIFPVERTAVPEPFKVTVRLPPPLILYVITAFGVPVKVMLVAVPEQIEVVPEIVAVGKALIDMVAEPD